jgi:hypothetical protein
MANINLALSDTLDARNLPQEQRNALAQDAANALLAEGKEALARQIGLPDTKVTNFIWITVVVAVALVLVGSAGAMMMVFATTGKSDPGAMLTVFTTVMGFVAGLLVRSPVAR